MPYRFLRELAALAFIAVAIYPGYVFAEATAPVESAAMPAVGAAHDIHRRFEAPDGKTVEITLHGPRGSGIYSRPMKPGETPDTYFPAVVQEAQSAGAHRLVIPHGTYTFDGPTMCKDLHDPACTAPTACNVNQYWNCAPHWTIGQYPVGQTKDPNSVSDLDIDFQGSVLQFKAPVIGIWILESQRLLLHDFTIDWPALPVASLGRIVADPLDAGHHALVIDEGYPVVDPFTTDAVQIQAVDKWDDAAETGGRFAPDAVNQFETYFIFGGAPQPTYVGKTSVGAQTFSCESCHFVNSSTDPSCSFFQGCANFDSFAIGTRVLVRHYTYNGIAMLVNWSNDIDVENARLLTGPGMGFAAHNEGGYRGFRLAGSQVTRAPGRLVSTASDAVNLGLRADILVEDDDIGFQGDDGINISPTTGSLLSVAGKIVTTPGVCDPDPMDSPVVGDRLEFFDADFARLGEAIVTALAGSDCGTLSLTLSASVPGLDVTGAYVDLTQQASGRFLIRNSRFHENRGHGVVTNAPYGQIEGNCFFSDSSGAINLSGGNGVGPGASNVTLLRNHIRAPGWASQSLGAITLLATTGAGAIPATPMFHDIAITDNEVERSRGPGLLVTSTRSFSVNGLRLDDDNLSRTAPTSYGSIDSNDSVVIYESSDGALSRIELHGKTTGAVGIDPTDRRVLLTPVDGAPQPRSSSCACAGIDASRSACAIR